MKQAEQSNAFTLGNKMPSSSSASAVLPGSSKSAQNSKWSINIQEIVKRTQRNLERGPAAKITSDNKKSLESGLRLGGSASSGTREKSSLLANGLKRKSYETSGPDMGPSMLGHGNLAFRKADSGNFGLAGISSAKSIRPQSAAAQIAAQSLRVANQKSAATQGSNPNYPVPRPRKNRDQPTSEMFYADRRHGQLNSAKSGGIAGLQGQGVGEYDNNMVQQRLAAHRTLEDGRFEVDEDDEAQVMSSNARILANHATSQNEYGNALIERQDSTPGLRNSNTNNLLGANTAAQKLRTGPIVEPISEEQTYRNNRSVERNQQVLSQLSGSLEDPEPTNYYGADFKHLRPSSSTGNAARFQHNFVESHKQPATTGFKSPSEVEHRQKIFEEEIIKRVKEIQRYVKSLHLQLKKTQSKQTKMREEVDSDKDVIMELQSTLEQLQKRYNQDKLKNVSQAELVDKVKELDYNFNEKIVSVVEEAVEATLTQVKDDLIPKSRLKMYDSITEETSRLKIEVEHEIQKLKRELMDESKSNRQKSQSLFEQEAATLRQELKSEQSTQNLQILNQVDDHIAKALRDQKSTQSPAIADLKNLKVELNDKLRECEQRLQHSIKSEFHQFQMNENQNLEQKLADLEADLVEQFQSKIAASTSGLLNHEDLSKEVSSLMSEMARLTQAESQKIDEANKMTYITQEKLQTDLQKLKREVSKQVKTGLEEAKFDTIQMLQQDLLEVTSQHKDTRFKLQELSVQHDDLKSLIDSNSKRDMLNEQNINTLKKQQSDLLDQNAEVERQIRQMKQDFTNLKNEAYSSKNSHKPEPTPIIDPQLDQKISQLQSAVSQLQDKQSELAGDLSESKMESFSFKANTQNQLAAIQKQIDESNQEQAESRENSDQNFENANQAFSQIQERIDELGGLEQLLEAQRQATKGISERLDKMENQSNLASQHPVQESQVKQQDLEDLKQMLEDKIYEDVKLAQKQSLSKIVEVEESMYTQIDNLKEGQTNHERQLSARASTASPHLNQMELFEKRLENLEAKNRALEAKIKEDAESVNVQIVDATNKITAVDDQVQRLDAKQQSLATRFAKTEAASALQKSPRDIQTIFEGKLKSVQESLRANIETNQSLNKGERAKIIEMVEKLRIKMDEVKDEAGQYESAINLKADELKKDTQERLEKLRDDMDRKIKEIPVQQVYGAGPAARQSSAASWEGRTSFKKVEPRQKSEWMEVKQTKIEPRQSLSQAKERRQSALGSGAPASAYSNQEQVKSIPVRQSQEQEPFQMANNSAIDISGSYDIKNPLNGSKTDLKKQNSSESGKQEALSKNSIKKSPSLQELEFGTGEESSPQKSHSPWRLQTDEPIESCTEYQSLNPVSEKRPEQLVINSPVQFQMMRESDVKVSSSAHSKLPTIKDEKSLPTQQQNITKLNQIISPTEVIANHPQNQNFYEFNKREAQSNHVSKKMDMALKAAPNDNRSDNMPTVSKPLDTQTPHKAEIVESQIELLLDNQGLSQEKPGIATAQLQEWQDDEMPINGESQLFRSQKMGGLGELTRKAQEDGEGHGQGDADLEFQKKLDGESALDSQNQGPESQRSYGNFIKRFEAKASMKKRTGGLMGLGLDNASEGGSNLEAGLDDILDSGNFCNNNDPLLDQFNQESAQKSDKLDSKMLDINQQDIGLLLNVRNSALQSEKDSEPISDNLPAFLANNKMKLNDGKNEGISGKNSLLQSLELGSIDGFNSKRSQVKSEQDQETMVATIIKQMVNSEIVGALDELVKLGHPNVTNHKIQK